MILKKEEEEEEQEVKIPQTYFLLPVGGAMALNHILHKYLFWLVLLSKVSKFWVILDHVLQLS